VTTDIVVPVLGESVTEATIAKWLKRPGDVVAVDEPVVELETEKATVELGAPSAGVLAEVLAAEGADVAVGSVIGRIAPSEGARAPEPKPETAVREAPPKPAPATEVRAESRRGSECRGGPRPAQRASQRARRADLRGRPARLPR
jgi:2-oxoglutarate dehydrogenase E2 component (dihydrolipoamide succinyltransferase)